jgi:hypothetical protein
MSYCLILAIIITVGCQKNDSDITSDPAPFENAEWLFYNEVTGEHDVIRFGEDNSFSYHCECGEPVGDADCYDMYRYDEEEMLITLYNDYDDSQKEIKVLSYNVLHLLLEIDGEIRDFSTVAMDNISNFWTEEGESYLSGYEMNRMLVEFTDKGVITAAFDYDTETQIPKGTLEEYALAEDVIFFDLSLHCLRKVEDEQEYEESYDVSFTELTREDMEYYLENGGLTSFLWLNEEMEIEKVVVWGITTVFE